ncbi:MAG: Rieske 2Fe-2S domain-containing protein [Candidatus Glassbacteria bacterium]|nr:Rieske 2Fe-2S domain-containing protein [Candidatus Glassbacteria bacterium]
MEILKRILGICKTKRPANPDCWRYIKGRVEVDLGLAVELVSPGDAIRLEGGDLGKERILVVCGESGTYHAYRNRCTHVGHRRIDTLPGESLLRCCSVSKSTYDYDGKVVSGPAGEPLTVLPAELGDGRLVIRLED